MRPAPRSLWTIGHSTREWEVFLAMLREAGIRTLADVRRFAGSRRHPQFAGTAMAGALRAAGMDYVPLPELGGLRTPRGDSPHTAWRNPGFRGYADYMGTPAYAEARERLAALALASPTCVMCAEAVWWQCHRGLLADDFKSRGWDVIHLLAPGRVEPHPYTAPARIVDGRLDYSLPPEPQADLF